MKNMMTRPVLAGALLLALLGGSLSPVNAAPADAHDQSPRAWIGAVDSKRHTIHFKGLTFRVADSCTYAGDALHGFADLKRGITVEYRLKNPNRVKQRVKALRRAGEDTNRARASEPVGTIIYLKTIPM